MYTCSSSTYLDHDVWLINLDPSFHMTPHREWFWKYEKYDGGDVFLGYDLTTKIIGRGRVRLKLKYKRVKTIPRDFHIPSLVEI
jgi:hypothetical protein